MGLCYLAAQRFQEAELAAYSRVCSCCHYSLLASAYAAHLRPTLVTYTAAISACESVKEWAEALALLDEMRLHNLVPGAFTYASVLTALEGSQEWERALALFRDSSAISSPNLVAYNAMIGCLEHARSPDGALELLWEMQQRRLDPTMVTYGAVARACEKGHKGLHLLHVLRQTECEGLGMSAVAR